MNKDEIALANKFINEEFSRIIDWAVGDVKRCCRMNENGTCENGGALVGAFILACCAIDYFGGLYTGYTTTGATKARFKFFIEKYMSRYDPVKIEDLRWSLVHYYSPHHFILYHENTLEENKDLHLRPTKNGINLHLGWFVKDLESAVNAYWEDLKKEDKLKIKAWKYWKEQLPIMPTKVENIIENSNVTQSLVAGTSIQQISASGTISGWYKK